MRVATILAIPYLNRAQEDTYHLCLAHLLADKTYATFFREKARRGDLVMMDNGVVETGLPMEWPLLVELAKEMEISELVLPDRILNASETLKHGEKAVKDWEAHDGYGFDLIAVPQGNSHDQWYACCQEMLHWPVKTIGISKFVGNFTNSRADLFEASPDLINSDKDIHMLGCLSVSDEVRDVEARFPGRIRGIDSGIATICTQANKRLQDVEGGRVDIPLDFFARNLNPALLGENIQWWKHMCRVA